MLNGEIELWNCGLLTRSEIVCNGGGFDVFARSFFAAPPA
jgi:hypothetical protein